MYHGYNTYLDEFGSQARQIPTVVLKRGSKGPLVKKLQEWLKTLGYSLTVDSDFGPGTKKQVKLFQKKSGLTVDGVVGSKTWTTLHTALTDKAITEPTWSAAERAEFEKLTAGSSAPKPSEIQRRLIADAGGLHDAMLNLAAKSGVTAPLRGPDPTSKGPPQVRPPDHGLKAVFDKADAVDWTVMGVSGLASGWLVGTLARGIDVPWWMGALAGLGVGGGAGLAASVKLRDKDKLAGDLEIDDYWLEY